MRHGITILLIVSLIGLGMLPIASVQAQQTISPPAVSATNRVIFKLRAAAPAYIANGDDSISQAIKLGRISSILGGSARPLFQANQGHSKLKRKVGLDRIFITTLPSHLGLSEALTLLSHVPDIEYAEPDFVGSGAANLFSDPLPLADLRFETQEGGPALPNDRYLTNQWGVNNTGQLNGKAGAHINAIAAWGITTGTNNVLIGMLDTGIDLSHSDLTKKVIGGYDFVNNDDFPQDDNGHGTHTAGIVAAQSNNGIGVAGVCWNCRMLAIKVLDEENRGYYSWWSSGIEYAVDHEVQAINMSMGGNSFSLSLQDAVRYAYFANVPILAAMMNEGNNALNYPAAFTETIAIGMTNRNDNRDIRSSYGAHIHLVSPGVDIYSTMRGNTYASMTGTSMATPYVTGVVGLLYSLLPNLTVEHVRRILRYGVDDPVGAKNEDAVGWDQYYGYGRLNALKALNYAQNSVLVGLRVSMSDFVPAKTPQSIRADISSAALIGAITYTWEATDLQPFVDRAESNASNITMTWNTAGAKVITVTADNGINIITATRNIEVFYPVQANFVTQPTPASGEAPLSVIFNNTSTGEGLSNLWSFGDGISSTEVHPTHVYMLPGSYSVELIVTNAVGISATLRLTNAVTVWSAATPTATMTLTQTPSPTHSLVVTSTPAPFFEITQLFLPAVLANLTESVIHTDTATITPTVNITYTPTPTTILFRP